MATVPLLDVSKYTSGTPAQRTAFTQDLLHSFQRYGFVRLENHGIPPSTVQELFDWTKRFFELPVDNKDAIAHPPGPEPQRGWSAVGRENTAKLFRHGRGTAELTDAREHFDAGAPAALSNPNRWPSEAALPGFRAFMERYYTACHSASQTILQAMEEALGVPAGSFAAMCRGGGSGKPGSAAGATTASELRLNHYPELPVQELRAGKVSRIHPHTDLGVITCLFQDGSGGLEVEDRDAQRANAGQIQLQQQLQQQQQHHWIPLLSPPGRETHELVVNISETFERWTNGNVRAGVHQVTAPAAMKDAREGVVGQRFSNAFFVKADREAPAGPLPACVPQNEKLIFDQCTAGEFHRRRLATAY